MMSLKQAFKTGFRIFSYRVNKLVMNAGARPLKAFYIISTVLKLTLNVIVS